MLVYIRLGNYSYKSQQSHTRSWLEIVCLDIHCDKSYNEGKSSSINIAQTP